MKRTWWHSLIKGKFQASGARSRGRRPVRGQRLLLEEFEDRLLLSFGTLPPYDPTRQTQTLFGSDSATLAVSPGFQIGTISKFYQFALNSQAAQVTAKFDLAPNNPLSPRDGALALYDSAGNRLAVADSDPVPGHPGFETLTTTVTPRQVYTLGVFFQAASSADQFTVTASLGPQLVQPAIALDLTTGKAPTTGDAFGTPTTVNYYPLNLRDAGAGATVTVTPTGLDVNAFATLFRRDRATDPWQPIESGSGKTAFSLTATPPANRSLTDAQYLLATAPVGFNTAARSYTIDLQATGPLLAPATVSLGSVTDLLTPPPVSPGTAQLTQVGILSAGAQQLFRLHTPAAGTATLTLQSDAFGPVLSVYDATGTTLLAVASSTVPGTAAVPLPVQAGGAYILRVSAANTSQAGAFGLTAQTPYVPTDLPLNPLTGNASVTTVGGLTVGPAQGARFFRLNPAAGVQILALGVMPSGANPIAAKVVLVGPNLAPQTLQVSAGQTLFLPVDLSGQAGAFDLYVAGTQGSDPATLQIGQLHIPSTLDLNTLAPAQIGPDGQLVSSPGVNPSAGPFGNLTGVQFYRPLTANSTVSLSVTGSGGAMPLLAQYHEEGGVLGLLKFALATSLADPLPADHLEGLAAFSLGFAGLGMNHFAVNAGAVQGTQVAMVPDLETDACTRFNAHCSIFKVRDGLLERTYQQQYWQTILPYNILAAPSLTFTPAPGAPQLTVQVSVYHKVNGNFVPLPGSPFTNPNAQSLGNGLAGQTLLFQVQPVANFPLGTGQYTLHMEVPTSDPTPFLVTETSWHFGNYVQGSFPSNLPVDVFQNQFGHGEAAGSFTSSQPYYAGGGAGALQVFRFWAISPGPVVVKTVLPNDPSTILHTSLKLYRAHFDSNRQVDSLTEITNVQRNDNWFPADRSLIDAQTYVNYFDQIRYDSSTDPYGTGGGLYYVVVKNQEGTTGNFRLVVDTAPFPILGNSANPPVNYLDATRGQTVYIPPTTGGTVRLNAYLGNFPGLVGYFPIQVPAYHAGTVQVTSLILNGQFSTSSGRWDLALFDATGNRLPGSVNDYFLGNLPYTVGTFTLPSGPQMEYLRIRSKESTPVDSHAQLLVSANLTSFSATPPPTTFSGTAAMLPTNPQGDGTLQDMVTARGQVKVYGFQAAAGPLTFHVAPDVAGDVQLIWGVYVGGNLIAWNQTGADPATTTATVLLPDLRQLSSNPDSDYDPALYDTVVIYVQAATAPTAGGHFTMTVQMAGFQAQRNLITGAPVDATGDLFQAALSPAVVQPMRNQDLIMNPLVDPGSTGNHSADSLNWSRVVVPDYFFGQVSLVVSLNESTSQRVRYDLYSIGFNDQEGYAGQLVASDSGFSIPIFGTNNIGFTLPTAVVGGRSYLLRVSNLDNAVDPLSVALTGQPGALPKARYPEPAAMETNLQQQGYPNPAANQLIIGPNGTVDSGAGIVFGPDRQHPELLVNTAFWVGNGGPVHLDMVIANQNPSHSLNPLFALYRGHGICTSQISCNVIGLTLVDYLNGSTNPQGGHFILDANLDPGMYVLQVINNSSYQPDVMANLQVTGQLPAYTPQDLVIDPNLGANSSAFGPLRNVSNVIAPQFVFDLTDPNLERYRHTFYKVIAPAGSQAGLTVTAIHPPDDNNQNPLSPTGADGWIDLWSPDGLGGFTGSRGRPLVAPDASNDQDGLLAIANAPPGQTYWIALQRDGLYGKVAVRAQFAVPMSGTPDWVVESVKLLPDHGQTQVVVTVRNRGNALADDTTAWLTYTDNTNPQSPKLTGPAPLPEYALAPNDVVTHIFTWLPLSPQDTVAYITNRVKDPSTGKLVPEHEELNYNNDDQTVALATVDPIRPVAAIRLADPLMAAPIGAHTWGRYVSILGINGATAPQTDVLIDFNDRVGNQTGGGLYQLSVEKPAPDSSQPTITVGAAGLAQTVTIPNFNFGQLRPTGGNVLNQFRFYAIDQYGLWSDVSVQNLLVVPLPSWAGGTWGNDNSNPITFDPATHQYKLTYHNAIVDKTGDLGDGDEDGDHGQDDFLPFSVPLIGDKDNRFLIEVTGTATVGLAPSGPITATVKAHGFLEVLGSTVFDQTYDATSAQQVTDHLQFIPKLLLDGTSLQATTFSVTFLLKDFNLLHYTTPEIPLVALGVPGVVDIQASVEFGIDVTLNAGLTVGLNLQTGAFGLLSPTFIAPSITASATISGEVQVVGIDLAKLSGTVSVTVTPAFGLPSLPPDQIVAFGDFLSTACFGVDGVLNISLKATVLGFKVWGWSPDPIPLFHGGCHVNTGQDNPPPVAPPTVHGGNDPVGRLELEPSPNLVIDPATGNALYLQVVNSAQDPAVVGNLAVSRRTGGTWSALTTLPQTTAVSRPVLAYSHDRAGTPAVVVYSALSTPGDPSALTENQYLTGQGLRWRYYDGSNWGTEQTLLADGRYNFNPAISFSSSGQGVVAWVHNTNPAPVSAGGLFDRTSNQIEVAVWNPATHTWGTPQALTGAGAYSNPTVYAGENGSLYVVWLQDTINGNIPLYSILNINGSGWSTPATLPVLGMSIGGRIREMALGSESPGRVDVLLAYDRLLPDDSVQHYLYNRPTTTAGFGSAAPVETVATHANFSHLRTLQAPGGGLIAYWQQSDGVVNEIFSSRIGPATSTWSAPAPLTAGNPLLTGSRQPTGTNIQFAPSVAVDTDGRYQVVYEVVAAPGAKPSPPRQDPPVGNPMTGAAGASSGRMLPQLAFAQPMSFAYRDPASSGTAVSNGAASGSKVIAQAQIVNRGLAGDSVRLDYFDGLPDQGGILLGSETIYLAPGQVFTIAHPFIVGSGTHTYAIRAVALGGQEIIPGSHVTSAALVGLIDVAVGQITLSDPNPHTGEPVTITADILNLSNLAVGTFDVAFYQGNPNMPGSAVLLGTRTISGLAANGHMAVSVPWTVPANGGNYILTVRADPGKVLQEATRNNNDGSIVVSLLPDAALVPVGSTPPVWVTVLNYSGVNNVMVTATVGNLGRADLTNVPVQVFWSLDGATFQPVGSTVIASLPAGTTKDVMFTVSGLAFHNVYRVVVDPNNALPDANRANNVAEAAVNLQGLPDLKVAPLSLTVTPEGFGSTLTVRIDNQGIAGASGIPVEVYALNVGFMSPTTTQVVAFGMLLGQAVIDRLGALSSTQRTFAIPTINLLDDQLCVVVDRAGKVTLADRQYNVGCILVPRIPAAPVNLTATAVADTQIRLSWTNQAVSATSITIERSFQGGAFTFLATVAPTTGAFVDSGLAPGTYSYRLQTFNGRNQSNYSNVASATIPTTPTHFGVTPSTTSLVAGTAFTITVTALTAGNQTALGYLGTVHFTSTDGQAMLPADYTFTAADRGVHTFTVTLKTAGNQTVTVRDLASSAVTGSAAVTVRPGPAATLRVAGFPSPTVAGVEGTLTVTALDAYGNVATGYLGTVRFSSSDPQVVLPTNVTFFAEDNGTRRVSVTLKTAGTQNLTATETGTATITGTQTGIVVTPAATARLSVSAPASTTAGMAFSLTVTAQDVYGNTTPAYGGTVTFTSTDSRATLPANATLTNGVGTFSGTLRTAGNQTVTATDTATGSITGSAAVNVVAGALDHWRVTSSADDGGAVAGRPFDVTVIAQDIYNNTVTTYTGTVTFSSQDPYGATLPPTYSFAIGDLGMHRFAGGATLYTAGTWDVTAADTATGATGSDFIQVAAGALDHFSVTTSADATGTTAGNPFDVTVAAQDAYNNTVTTYGGTVTFSSQDPYGASLPADYTFQASDQGQVTFGAGVTLYTAGTWDVTATDTATGATGSDFIAVTAAPAVAFQVIAPPNATSGQAFDITVVAVDPYGNTDSNYQGTVHFSSTDRDSGVALPADYSFQSADAGAATFPASVTLITPGTQTVTATDTVSGITGSATVTVSSTGGGSGGNSARYLGRAVTAQPHATQSVAGPAGHAGAVAPDREGRDRFFAAAAPAEATGRPGIVRAWDWVRTETPAPEVFDLALGGFGDRLLLGVLLENLALARVARDDS